VEGNASKIYNIKFEATTTTTTTYFFIIYHIKLITKSHVIKICYYP